MKRTNTKKLPPIDWYLISKNEENYRYVSAEELVKKFEGIKCSELKYKAHTTTIGEITWFYVPTGLDNLTNGFYSFDEYGQPVIYKIGEEGKADKASSYFKEFKNLVETEYGYTFDSMFGTDDPTLHFLCRCVPSPISWATSKSGVYSNVWKADVSSCFPFEATKPLPTLIGAKRVLGLDVEPTPEFPFAFRSNGTMKIYGEDIETRKTFDKYYNHTAHNKSYDKRQKEQNYSLPEKSFTLLCPACKHSLAPVFERLYAQRKEDAFKKDVMNMTIGMFYARRDPHYWYLAATILARADARIISYAKKLEAANCLPLLIATDSIAWQPQSLCGNHINEIPFEVYNKNNTEDVARGKQLGDFCLERFGCDAAIASPKCYQLQEDGKTTTIWAGKRENNIAGINFGDIFKEKYIPKKLVIMNGYLKLVNDYGDIEYNYDYKRQE